MGVANVARTMRALQFRRAARIILNYYQTWADWKTLKTGTGQWQGLGFADAPGADEKPSPAPKVETLVCPVNDGVISDRAERGGEADLPHLRAQLQAVLVKDGGPAAMDETFFVAKKVADSGIKGLQTVVETKMGQIAAAGFVGSSARAASFFFDPRDPRPTAVRAAGHVKATLQLLKGVRERQGSEITTLYIDNAPNGLPEYRSVCPKIVLRQDLKHVDGRLLDQTRSHMRDFAAQFGRELSKCYWSYDENDVLAVERKRGVSRDTTGFYKTFLAVSL